MRTAVSRPLQRPVPLRQSVYDALIDLIVSGELPPGQHMVETDLARQLGVSRQPIREALHRMEAEGWVDLRPSQGAFVHVPTSSEVNELLDVRALLEAETARLAARAASPAQVARLREICAAGQEAAEADDLSRAVAANDLFHAEIAVVAGNSVLAELADIVGRRVQWYYRMVAPERGHGSWAEHAELIDAIEASDPEQAQLLARKHTERTREAYHRALFSPRTHPIFPADPTLFFPRTHPTFPADPPYFSRGPTLWEPDHAHRVRGVRVVRVVDELDLAPVGHDVVRPVGAVFPDDRVRAVGVPVPLLGVGVGGVLLRVDRRLVPPDEPVGGERQPELVRVHRPPNAVDTLSMIVVDALLGAHQPQGPQQFVLPGAGTGGSGEFVQAPAGLIEQVHGLAEQRVPLGRRDRALHEVPHDLDHRRA
jgi:DNA-binding GntR family transcriptional regulator